MEKVKAYTDIVQSKKLAEILAIESADMCFNISQRSNMPPLMTPYSKFKEFFDMDKTPDFLIPCWSLSALLDILPDDTNIIKDKSDTENEKYMCTVGVKGGIISTFGNNPVDACYEMIIKLHEQNIL